jgi:biotin transporter BioY
MKTIEFTMTTSFPQLPLGPAGGYDIGYVLNLFTVLPFQSQILNGESPIELLLFLSILFAESLIYHKISFRS